MAHRLGNVLCGFGALVALACVALLLQAVSMNLPANALLCGLFAVLAIGAGRTAKYLVAGR